MEKKIYIAGAHSRAQTLAVYLQYLYPDVSIESYLYDNDEKNPESIEGIKVLCLESGEKLHTDYPVYIGTRGVFHERIAANLRQKGFRKIYPVTVDLDLQLRNEYMKKYFDSMGRKFLKIHMLNEAGKNKVKADGTAVVYVARSIMDKTLQQEYELASYEKEIQAGAALTSEPLRPDILTDDIGDNISVRNSQYCELTALYWIWKHAKEDIVGLAHYRRHFILPANWVEIMEDNGIDVILPVPLYVLPNLADNYKKRHDAGDWDFMMRYLKEKSVSLYEEAQEFFRGNLYSPCNMFIMRRKVLNEFCEWLFSILDAVTAHGGEKEDRYLNRYPGFIAERLLTFFFEKNKDIYKVIYADKNFLR